MGSFLSDPYFKYFLSTINVFIPIFMIQILHNITNCRIFSDIGWNCLLGNRKKIAKFLMRTFTCWSTFFYGSPAWQRCTNLDVEREMLLTFSTKAHLLSTDDSWISITVGSFQVSIWQTLLIKLEYSTYLE